jgi:hypothetical protein
MTKTDAIQIGEQMFSSWPKDAFTLDTRVTNLKKAADSG